MTYPLCKNILLIIIITKVRSLIPTFRYSVRKIERILNEGKELGCRKICYKLIFIRKNDSQ